MFKTRLVSSVALLAFCGACARNPSLSSTAAGGATAVSPSEIVLRLNVSTHMYGHLIASNIYNVTASHIHSGAVGSPGPAVVFLYGPAPAGGGRHDGVLATGTVTAANFVGPLAGRPFSDLIALIESGNAYANVHTNDGIGPTDTGPGDFPGGEIRGQVRK